MQLGIGPGMANQVAIVMLFPFFYFIHGDYG